MLIFIKNDDQLENTFNSYFNHVLHYLMYLYNSYKSQKYTNYFRILMIVNEHKHLYLSLNIIYIQQLLTEIIPVY